MSEHIQTPSGGRQPPETSLGGLTPPAQEQAHEHTPGVHHESLAFDFRLILCVGGGLVATALIVHVAVWWLLGDLERQHSVPPSSVSELVQEDAMRTIGQRVENVPGPRLEGIERQSSLLIVRTDDGEEQRFYTSVDVRIRIGGNENARLFELREGQRVTLTYYFPGGAAVGIGVVTSVTSPPGEAEQKKPEPELPDVSRTLNAAIIKIEPRGIAEARKWAEVQMQRYGWIDGQKEIVHIPVEKAMEQVLRSKEFGSASDKNKAAGGKR